MSANFYLNSLRLFAASLILALPQARAFVIQTDHELITTVQLQKGQDEAVLVVDRATGLFRMAYSAFGFAPQWSDPRSTGLQNVSGLGVGRFFNVDEDAFAVTSPEANRINLIKASTPDNLIFPVSLYSGTGPSQVVALDIGGIGNTPVDDLLACSIWNNPPSRRQVELFRGTGMAWSSLTNHALPAAWKQASRISAQRFSVLQEGGTDTFLLFDVTKGNLVQMASEILPFSGASYLPYTLEGAAYPAFIFYKPGQNLIWYSTLKDNGMGSYQMGPGISYTAPFPVELLIPLTTAASRRIAVIFNQGTTLAICDFDGLKEPVLDQVFQAEPGEHYSGMAAAGADLMVLSARSGERSSSTSRLVKWNGLKYEFRPPASMPALRPGTAAANVFLFNTEPFVHSNPGLVRSLNAGDWSSSLNWSSAPAQLSVTREDYAGTAPGLNNPQAISLGPIPVTAQAGLVNQYARAMSLFSYETRIGDEVVEVQLSPEPGQYKTSITLSFATFPKAAVFYRFQSTDPWTLFTTKPIVLFKNTTVQYYARPLSGPGQSMVRQAAYTFAIDPAHLDSDEDGVPDFVELAHGLDPLESGNDADGDGAFDLDELLAGTDPASTNSPGTNILASLERKASFDLVLNPRSPNGQGHNLSMLQPGALFRAYDLQGGMLAFGRSMNFLSYPLITSSVRLTNIAADTRQRLIAAASESHYDLFLSGTDQRLGREMLTLVPVPERLSYPDVAYTFTEATLTQQAAYWVTVARNTQSAIQREILRRPLTPEDSLVALLVEKKIAEILLARGVASATNLTLFPFRAGDQNRSSLDQAQLLALEQRGPGNSPAYRLKTIYLSLSNAVAFASLSGVSDLKSLVSELYRISAAYNNASPGKFPLPIDELREFFTSQAITSNYLAQTILSSDQIKNAQSAVGQLLQAIPSRPSTNLIVVVTPETLNGSCRRVVQSSSSTIWELLDQKANPYAFTEAFHLLPGSELNVIGYTDLDLSSCGGQSLEVTAIRLLAVPRASDEDTDGNLLLDSWERFFFGDMGTDAFTDSDGDQFMNLQELLDGSDPRDAQSHSGNAVVLHRPEIQLDLLPSGEVLLSWYWPAHYANRVRFIIRSTYSLSDPFTDELLGAIHVGNNLFQAKLPTPASLHRFYTVQLKIE